jgi:alpha-galactosidase/6-phospho-beta-glucosidase family protein
LEATLPQPKIVIVGGGSYQWGPTFLRDIFLHPQLQGSTIVLHDIDSEPLNLIYSLGQKLNAFLQCDFTIQKTLSLDEALQGADFVILTISTGALEAMQHDLEIPEKYGIYQSVGDTVGPGGLARALRNIPVVVSIAQRMDEICPNAWLLNYTNPMTTLTRAVNQQSHIKTIGLCHELIGVRHRLAHMLSVSPAQIKTQVAGINHLIWILGMTIDGEDAFPRLAALTQDVLNDRLSTGEPKHSLSDQFRVKSRLFQIFGALPAAGDRHVAEFFPFFLSETALKGTNYGVIRTSIAERYEWRKAARGMVEDILAGRIDPKPFLQHASEEAAAPIIAAISNDEQYQGIMNLPNQGQISNLPQHVVVETFGIVDALGARGIVAGPLPDGIHAITSRHVENQEMIVTAALTGNKKLALQALLNDPLATNVSTAEDLLDEMLAANKQYLPQF